MSPDWATLVGTHLNWEWDGAKTIGQIQEEIGCPRRIVEAAIETLRKEGRPIVTGPSGVYLTHNPDELLDSYRRLRRRAITQLSNLRAMRRTAARMRTPVVVQQDLGI